MKDNSNKRRGEMRDAVHAAVDMVPSVWNQMYDSTPCFRHMCAAAESHNVTTQRRVQRTRQSCTEGVGCRRFPRRPTPQRARVAVRANS